MFKRLTVFIVITLISNFCFAQNNFTISGIVKDNKETLPGAAIYVSGYKISTVTDNSGKFVLPNLAPGNYDILVQMLGYLPYSKNIIITDKSVEVNIILQDNPVMLKEVVIKPDPNRAFYLAMFKDFFIGKTPNTKDCKILNPEVLIIDYNNGVLTVKTNEFLVIENKALGYRLKYLLEYFEYNNKTRIVYYGGHPYFEEMQGGKSKQKRWIKNREAAYYGSLQHFFKSLYHQKTKEEGYIIYKLIEVKNNNRKPDSLINANVKHLTSGQQGLTRIITYRGNDSLSYWLKQRSEPKTLNVLNRNEIQTDTLVKFYDNNLKMINYTDDLFVMYTKELETTAYDNSGHKQPRPLTIPNYQISVLKLVSAPALFYQNGGIYDAKSLLTSGYWAYEKIADMVPLDYK